MVLICKTLSPFYQGMLYAKFGLNWPIISGEKIFAISWLSPNEKGHDPSFEQTGILMTQGCFVATLLKLTQFVL